MSNRAGSFVRQIEGYTSFKPCQLPIDGGISYDPEMLSLLSSADRKLGRLDGITQILPNPDLFVAMYVKKEAVLSSQIEGTQASMSDLLDLDERIEKREDVSEVVNYVSALKYGLDRLQNFPLSLRLIRDIHSKLLQSGRGSNRNPGEFRSTQNWIGPYGCTLNTATFVPPCVPDMKEALNNLELYLYNQEDIPILIKIAIIHAQFESIHPFLDGNGRIGRLLITFLLCNEKILTAPLLYLSYYFKKNRSEYYDNLMNVRLKGDWEKWIKFFLRGISEVSDEATETGKEIIALKTKCENIISNSNIHSSQVLDYIFEFPFVTKNRIKELLNISYPTASKIVDDFCAMGILHDASPNQQRNKKYRFSEYLSILNKGTEI